MGVGGEKAVWGGRLGYVLEHLVGAITRVVVDTYLFTNLSTYATIIYLSYL